MYFKHYSDTKYNLTMLYLATSVDVEQVFSKHWLILSHVHNHLTSQSTHALMCLGVWSALGYVRDKDVLSVTKLPDLMKGEEDEALDDG